MAINQKPTGKVTIYGDFTVDSVLRVSNTLADANGLGVLRYQWLLNGKAIVGATASELLLTKDFLGNKVSVEINYLDGSGFQEKVLSGINYLNTSYDLFASRYWISSNAVLDGGVKYTKDNPLTVMQTTQIDWNGDGKEDILTFDSYPLDAAIPNPPPSIFLNNGVALEKSVWSGPSLTNPHGVKLLLGDFDEDGNPDVFSLVAIDPPFGKFPDLQDFNNIIFSGPVIRVKEFQEFKGFWYAGASGDINNDGHVDVVIFNFHVGANGVQNQILWNDGKANFRFDTNGLTNLQIDQAELRDINRDGYLDLIVDKLDSSGRHISVMWGNGANFDTSRSVSFDLSLSFFVGNLSFADLNNDRLDEIIVSGVNDKGIYSIFIYGSNDSGKSYSDISSSTIENNSGNKRFDHIKIEDLDGNGLIDIFAPDMADNIRWEWSGSVFKPVSKALTGLGTWLIDKYLVTPYINNNPIGSVVITGSLKQGEALKATNSIQDPDGLGAITYQWQSSSDGSDWLTLSTGSTYTLQEAQVGKQIKVRALYSDGHGTSEAVSSAALSAVANVNDTPTGSVVITGVLKQGETLKATNSIQDPDGVGVITYQWQSSSDGINWINTLINAGDTLTLSEREVNRQISVIASYTDGHGTSEKLKSSATDKLSVNFISGTSNSDLIQGTAFADNISTFAGNDTIAGGLGSDVIDGGSGIDTVKFAGQFGSESLANYSIQKLSNGSWSVSYIGPMIAIYPPPATDGSDLLTYVERILFTDKSFALDMDGNAGNAAKIIGAVLGKAALKNPTYVGIGLNYLDNGMSYSDLGALALNAVGAVTDETIVSTLWLNVIGFPALAIDKAPFLKMLAEGLKPGDLVALAADTAFNTSSINLVGLAQTGIEYVPV